MGTFKTLVFVLIVALAGTATAAQGQGKSPGSRLRTVHGTVVDKSEVPIDSAVVYLKNLGTQDITTHISDKDGRFSFSGLDLNVDYEIHAERQGMTSTSRSISNFDDRKEFVLTLKVDRKKSEK